MTGRLAFDLSENKLPGTAPLRRHMVLAGMAFLVSASTSSSASTLSLFDGTSAALAGASATAKPQAPLDLACAAQIHEARRLSGLTWDELSRVMGASRRTLHLWAGGRPINAGNEARLGRLLGTLRVVHRTTGKGTRQALLAPLPNGEVPLDMLIGGRFDEVANALGTVECAGTVRMPKIAPRAVAARRPPPPLALMDAVQDPVLGSDAPLARTKLVRRPVRSA